MYRVELEGRVIGKTALEAADPPMGVVMGKLRPSDDISLYELFKDYCEINEVTIHANDEEEGLLDTENIPQLRVFREDGFEIEGEPGASVSGFRDGDFDITIIGVSYPFYEEEFPHHVRQYNRENASAEPTYDPLNDFGLGRATTPVGGGAGLLKIILGWFRR